MVFAPYKFKTLKILFKKWLKKNTLQLLDKDAGYYIFQIEAKSLAKIYYRTGLKNFSNSAFNSP